MLISISLPQSGFSQNLVPNPSFESYTTCPTGYNPIGSEVQCAPWVTTTAASSDYFHPCSNPGVSGVPYNHFGLFGYQVPHSGQAYINLACKWASPLDYREYVTAPLLEPLEAGTAYLVSFYVNCANMSCGIEQFGAHISNAFPTIPSNYMEPLLVTPQIESNNGFLTDTMDWTLISGCYIAMGGEQYITIGNFHSNAETPTNPDCAFLPWSPVYYYVDDVSVEEIGVGNLDLDLIDGPISSCSPVTIEAGVSGVDYEWNTGSTEPSITVSTSGIYVLTITSICDFGVDSVEFILVETPPVSISPNDTLICPDESFTISLDPDLGTYEWSDGSTSSEYEISNEGLYIVTFNDGCNESTDSIQVEVLDLPVPYDIGEDMILCVGDSFQIFVDPTIEDFEWQDGSAANPYTIYEEGLYWITVSNMCGEATTDREVFGLEIIPVQLPASDTLCDGDLLNIQLDPAGGPYLWQDGSTSASYQISNPGMYAVTSTQYCGTSNDSITILTGTTPQFDFGASIAACPGDTFYLVAVIPASQYMWSDGSTNDSLTVTTDGQYSLSVTNTCGTHQDTVLIQYGQLVVPVDLGPDILLCNGQEIILQAGGQAANYVWQDNSTADTLLINAPGNYSVTVSNNCFTYSDAINVSLIDDVPALNLPDLITICENATYTIDPGIANASFAWSDGSAASTLLINTPGMYSVTVSNGCGTIADTVEILSGGPLPYVVLGPDTAICPGTVLTLQPIGSDITLWSWSNGSTDPTTTYDTPGNITITVSNSCGVNYDTLVLDFLPTVPPLDLGVDTALCSIETITLNIPIQNVDILWSDGSTGSQFVVDDEGTYTASISNTCGTSFDTIIIGLIPDVQTLELGNDIPLCPGEVITITPNITGSTYLWQDGSTDTFFIADQPMTISLTISNECSSSTDDLTVYISTNGPVVDLGEDIVSCENEIVTLNAQISGVSYLWQDGSVGQSIQVSSSGIYILQVFNSCGMDADTIDVLFDGLPPVVQLGQDTSLCEGVVLNLSVINDGLTTTVWQDGSTLSFLQVAQPGMYTATSTNECGFDSDSIEIQYITLPPIIDLGPDTVLCQGEILLLSAPLTSENIVWQDGSSEPILEVENSGLYSLEVSNVCGSQADEINIFFDNQPIIIPATDTMLICPGETIELEVSQSIPTDYLWNTGSDASSISILTPGIYSVTLITECQEAETEFVVDFNSYCGDDIYIPNIFSPNQDQINDVFRVYVNEKTNVLSLEGTIFDRWGNLLYSSQEIPFAWDGTFQGDFMQPGVYVYKISIKYISLGQELEEKLTGDVTIVR